MSLKIKDWDRFQHFKDRKPPWIKLYRDILDDIEWHKLDGASAKILTMLWLLASEGEEGELPAVSEIAFRFRISETSIKSTISKLDHWLIQDDINLISEGHQSDPLETEGETEGETEKRQSKNKKFTVPTFTQVKAYCDERKNGIDPQNFLDSNEQKGWVVGRNKTPMKSWEAAIRTWEKYQKTDEKPKNQMENVI